MAGERERPYRRSSAHRFEVGFDLANADAPAISGHGSAWTQLNGSVRRTVFLTLQDDHDHARATVFLSVDQAERTAHLLLDLVERTRAVSPAPNDDLLGRDGRVEALTAWPPEEGSDRG